MDLKELELIRTLVDHTFLYNELVWEKFLSALLSMKIFV